MIDKNEKCIYVLKIEELDYSVRYSLETFRTRRSTKLVSMSFLDLFLVAYSLIFSTVSMQIYSIPFVNSGVMDIDRMYPHGELLVSFICGWKDAYFRIKFLGSKRDNYPYPNIIEVKESCRYLLIEYEI